jgi:hypothetical protein
MPSGRTKTYEWTEHLQCHHAGKPHDKRKPDLSPQKRRPNQQPSVKVGCTASIWLRKTLGQDTVEVEYRWKHKNHEVGSLDEMRQSMMPVALREWLSELVAEGLDWPQIKTRLRIDEEILMRLGDSSTTVLQVPETLRVAQKDVYNLIRVRLRALAVLDAKDGRRSLGLWVKKLEGKGYRVYYRPVSAQAAGENHYVFGFVSPWQQEVS